MDSATQKTSVSALIKQAQTMSLSELATVSEALAHLVAQSKKKPKGSYKSIEEDLFYTEVSSQLTSVIGKQPPYAQFKALHGTDLKNCIQFLNSYLSDILGENTVRREVKLKFFKIYADVMIGFFKTQPYPLSMKLLVQSYSSFPGFLENQFPGYIQSGLARFIFHDEEPA